MSPSVRNRVLLAAAWLAIVVTVSASTWLVVDAVGRDVGTSRADQVAAVRSASGPTVTAATPDRSAASPEASNLPQGEASPGGESSGGPSAEVDPSPSGPAPAGVRPSGPAGGRSPTSGSPPAAIAPSAAPGAPGATSGDPGRTVTSAGGTVVARCVDGRVQVLGITARDGWRVENETEDGGLEVKFRSGDNEVKIKVGCVDGRAVATVESS